MAIEKAPAIQQRVNLDQQPIRQKENPAVSNAPSSAPAVNAAPKAAEKNEKPSEFAANAPKSALVESENAVKDGFEAIAQKARQLFNNVIAPQQQPPAAQAQAAAPKNDQVAQTQAKDNQGVVAASNKVNIEQVKTTGNGTTQEKAAIQDVSQQVKEAPTADAPTSAVSAPKAPTEVQEESSGNPPAAKTPGEAPTISKILDDNLAALRKAQASPVAQAAQAPEAGPAPTATA